MTAPLRPTDKPDPLALLTQTALVILLAVVAVRATTNELSSDAFGLGGSADGGGGPGPTTTILLNLLCLTPALLVLIRRAIDPTYVLRWHVSHVLAFALAAWITSSAIWAGNQFDALLYASTWWAAAAVLWATGQLVRSWTRLRPTLGVAAGLCAIFVAQGLAYRYYEQPELLHYWETDPDLKARRAADPDDFAIKQMDRAVHGGAQQGFFRSPNSYAAAAVLAALVTAGFVGQRLLSKEGLGFAAGLAVPVIATPLLIWWTGSRTAGAAAVLAAVALAVAWWQRDRLTARFRLAYAVGIGLAVMGVAVVVGIGVTTGGLLHDSLNFRWNYWTASARLVAQHPLLGVGWTNFGTHYLGVRLPVAAEEIKDPHNVFVRFATETGVVGLLLAVAWLALAFREITRPITPKTPATSAAPQVWMPTALGIAALYWPLRTAMLWPLSVTLTEAAKTLLFALLLLGGLLLTVVRNAKDADADDRPAPFLVVAAVVGLLAFLLHNQVDFALSETGPLLMFMLVLGGLLGVRHPGVAGKTTHTAAAIAGLAGAFLLLIAAAGLWAVPVMLAEAKAADAEAAGAQAAEAMKAGRPDTAAAKAGEASEAYRQAIAESPVPNPAYALRAVRWAAADDPKAVLALFDRAIVADPADPRPRLDRARFGLRVHADRSAVLGDFAEFVKRNPNDAPVRIEYADALEAAGRHDRAVEQWRAALAANDALNPDEPRRLKPGQVQAIRNRIEEKSGHG